MECLLLTLFVGDNNSGKSYMMSLIWALTSGTQNEVIFAGLNNIIQKRYKTIYDRILGLIETIVKGESTEERFEESEFVDIINELLDRNKTPSLFQITKITIFSNLAQPHTNITITTKRINRMQSLKKVSLVISSATCSSFDNRRYLAIVLPKAVQELSSAALCI